MCVSLSRLWKKIQPWFYLFISKRMQLDEHAERSTSGDNQNQQLQQFIEAEESQSLKTAQQAPVLPVPAGNLAAAFASTRRNLGHSNSNSNSNSSSGRSTPGPESRASTPS